MQGSDMMAIFCIPTTMSSILDIKQMVYWCSSVTRLLSKFSLNARVPIQLMGCLINQNGCTSGIPFGGWIMEKQVYYAVQVYKARACVRVWRIHFLKLFSTSFRGDWSKVDLESNMSRCILKSYRKAHQAFPGHSAQLVLWSISCFSSKPA